MSDFGERFVADTPDYIVRPIDAAAVKRERQRARVFWQASPTNDYYRQFQPQTLLLMHILRSIGSRSVLELGCNVGRNLYWIKRFLPGIRVAGLDVNPNAIVAGKALFGFTDDELWVADDDSLTGIGAGSFDAVFTVSVLDHLPEIEDTVRQMLRIAKRRVLLIELALSEFGQINDPRCIDCSYSHDYVGIFSRLRCDIVSHAPAPLGEGILEHYEFFEAKPKRGWHARLGIH
jgi:SAM-dependent methyltransferase